MDREYSFNWKIVRGKNIYKIDTGKIDVNAEQPDGKYPFFTCSMFPKRIESFAFDCEALLVAGNGLVGYTQYYKGKFNAYQRTYVLSKFKNIKPQFLKYYMSNNLTTEVAPNSVGSVIQFIKLGDLQNFNICLPPIDEQNKIVDFLDNKVKEIDNAIERTKQNIEDYKLYKQSIISKTITRGIENKNLKKTNSIYFQKIPKTWDIKKIKYIFEIKKNIACKIGYNVLAITQSGIKIKDISKNEGQISQDYSKYQLVDVGDLQ